jgi:hypothetical protein
MRKSLVAVLVLCGLFIAVGAAHANDVYISQNGGGVGSSCGSTLAIGYFNTGANWTSGTPTGTQIGPGTIVHLCGTFSMPGGTDGVFVFQGSGNANNPITLTFETNAVGTAPYWASQPGGRGFIGCGGQSYIIIDGGTNGLITATANGAALANNVASNGMNCSGASHSEIKNLNITNIYVGVEGAAAQDNVDSACIYYQGGSFVHIHNNTTHDCRWNYRLWYGAGGTQDSSWEIDHNTFYNDDHMIAFGSATGGSTLIGTNSIHDNHCGSQASGLDGGWTHFSTNAGSNHHNCFHIWSVHGGSSINDIKIYNNESYGDAIDSGYSDWTSMIYIENSTGGIHAEIFNNTLQQTNPTSPVNVAGAGNGLSFCQGSVCAYYNNVFMNATNNTNCCGNAMLQSETDGGTTPTLTVENNIFIHGAVPMDLRSGGAIATWDHNEYYDVGTGGWDGTNYGSFAAWQSGCSCDANAVTTDPKLTAGYIPQSGSGAITHAANLTSLGITALDSDKAGVARPGGSTAWDIAAFQATPAPAPPTNLTAVIQ